MNKRILHTMVKAHSSDVESAYGDEHLRNHTVNSLSWSGISVSVHDKTSEREKFLLENIDGNVRAGLFYLSLTDRLKIANGGSR